VETVRTCPWATPGSTTVRPVTARFSCGSVGGSAGRLSSTRGPGVSFTCVGYGRGAAGDRRDTKAGDQPLCPQGQRSQADKNFKGLFLPRHLVSASLAAPWGKAQSSAERSGQNAQERRGVGPSGMPGAMTSGRAAGNPEAQHLRDGRHTSTGRTSLLRSRVTPWV
jgi:hypothetical protein